jgi:hypothetical protein
MRASSLIHLAVLPFLATAQIGNFLNLWTDHACSAPLDVSNLTVKYENSVLLNVALRPLYIHKEGVAD